MEYSHNASELVMENERESDSESESDLETDLVTEQVLEYRSVSVNDREISQEI